MHPRLSIGPALGLMCAAGLAAAALAGGSSQAAEPSAPPQAATAPMPSALPPGSTVVARVDGTELHLSEVEAAQQSLPQAQKLPLEQIYPVLLDRLVDGMLITEAGRKDHLDQDPELQRRLQRYEDR
jgi:peptidyl-prolyl cis-trans isomerase C